MNQSSLGTKGMGSGPEEEETDPALPTTQLLELLEDLVASYSGLSFTDVEKNVNNIQVTLDEKITKIEESYDSIKGSIMSEHKAKYSFLMGKMYSVLTKYRSKAIDFLGKTVKLDPSNIDAWNELGELYWKGNEVILAKKCFESAEKQKKNKVSLRNLSIISRREAVGNRESNYDKITEGITFAKEAVQLDPMDGDSWGILGNAYLAAYFQPHGQPSTLASAISAYKLADKSPKAATNSDLHYNKGIAFKFDEQYELSIASFRRAMEIDPNWDLCSGTLDKLIEYILKVQDLVRNKGKVRQKRLQAMVEEIREVSHPLVSSHETVELSNLEQGSNTNKIISGKVIWSVQLDSSFPFTFGIIDRKGEIGVVTMYNLALSKGFKIGDTITIPDPAFVRVAFELDGNKISFPKIRVHSPLNVYMNGKNVPQSFYAHMVWDSCLY